MELGPSLASSKSSAIHQHNGPWAAACSGGSIDARVTMSQPMSVSRYRLAGQLTRRSIDTCHQESAYSLGLSLLPKQANRIAWQTTCANALPSVQHWGEHGKHVFLTATGGPLGRFCGARSST
eukprot:1145675-Pelagomonas_calceolata.AAC.2